MRLRRPCKMGLRVISYPHIHSHQHQLTQSISHTPKQTPHSDTRSEIYPYRTLAKNENMKTPKNAQNIGNHARKCIWHCFSCEMGYLSTRLRSFTRLKISENCAEINPSRTRNNAIYAYHPISLYFGNATWSLPSTAPWITGHLCFEDTLS